MNSTQTRQIREIFEQGSRRQSASGPIHWLFEAAQTRSQTYEEEFGCTIDMMKAWSREWCDRHNITDLLRLVEVDLD